MRLFQNGTLETPAKTLMAVERRTRVRFFLSFWLFVLSAVAFLDRTNISVAGLQIGRDFGLSNQHLGWIFSAFLIGYAAFQLPAGVLAVRYGPRRVLTIGVLIWGLATALTAILPTGMPDALLFLILVRCALGIGETVIYPAANQFVARWIPQEERGIVNGLIFAGVGAGSGLTPPLLTWIIVEHGWRAAFWFSAIVGVLASAVWWVFARDTPEEHPGVTRAERREIREGLTCHSVAAPAARQGGSRKIFWRAMFSRPDLVALMLGYFSFGYVAWVFFSWFYLYLAQARGFNLKASAYFTMLPFICMTVFCLLGGGLSDRLTRRYGLRVGRCLLASVSLFLTSLLLLTGSRVHTPRLAVVVLAAGAGALYLSQSTFWSVSVDIAGRSSGVFSSLVNMSGQIGGAITASLTPWLAQHFNWTMPFTVAAALASAGALSWLMVHPEQSMDE
jgi:ACS family glucarate transporter-like MFS transporter